MTRRDITGQIFGRLTVIEHAGTHENGQSALWKCSCICGSTKIASTRSLKLGKTKSCGCYRKEFNTLLYSGETAHGWKGGVVSSNVIARNKVTYHQWRKAVYERDNFTCKKCREKVRTLEAHHINNFSDNEELRTNLSNGITLCKSCHRTFHRKYTTRNNTYAQLVEFIQGEIFNVRSVQCSNGFCFPGF